MFSKLPDSVENSLGWKWEEFSPFYEDLLNRNLTEENLHQWMCDWNAIQNFSVEIQSHLYCATAHDTTDEISKASYQKYSKIIENDISRCNQKLNEKLVNSNLKPENFLLPLRNIKNEISLYREENEPLLIEIEKILHSYKQIIGNRTVETDKGEVTIAELKLDLQDQNRDVREKAWRKERDRCSQDKEKINLLWIKLVKLRTELARNSGFNSFSEYQISLLNNTDYSINNIKELHQSIIDFIFPGASRTYRRRQENLELESLKPWDLEVDFYGEDALKPFDSIEELTSKTHAVLSNLDPQFGNYYQIMLDNNMMDIEKKLNKFSSFFDLRFPVTEIPFIFQSVVNNNSSLVEHFHEVGHAIHIFEMKELPYWQQRKTNFGIEETVAHSFNLISLNYLEKKHGGFYSKKEVALSKIRLLEKWLLISRFSTIADSFIIWAYDNPDLSIDPANCDSHWSDLIKLFMPEVNYEGLEEERSMMWQTYPYIFSLPFIYSEYCLGMLGALQIWENYGKDPEETIKRLRYGMSLGETRSRTKLFSAIGNRLAFDGKSVLKSAALLMRTILELETEI